MSSTVSNPYSFNIQNNTSFNSNIKASNILKTIAFSSDGRYHGSTSILENGVSSKFKVMLMFCANLDISTGEEEKPIYDPDKWEILMPPVYGVFNLIGNGSTHFNRSFYKFDTTSGGLILSYTQFPQYNNGSGNGGYPGGGGGGNDYKYGYLKLYTYKVGRYNSTILTEILTGLPAENILILMREYDGVVDDSYFIEYSTPEFENDSTIKSAVGLFDPSIFKTITDNYFVLNT